MYRKGGYMLKILCFLLGLNCLVGGWFWTGAVLLWIVFFEEFKD